MWQEDFAQHLVVREHGAHAKCAACVKHKLILKRLGDDRSAYRRQMSEFSRHLTRQYNDRLMYWKSRARSRLPSLPSGSRSIVAIVDGMDHAKYRWPRSSNMISKDFASFVRPHLDCTGLLCHGHCAVLALSEGFVQKDASWAVELLCHVMHEISARDSVDLTDAEFVVQADNCSREAKNNTMARYLGLMVASGRLKRAEMRFLQSGHSHEDIDAWFGNLSSWIQSHKEIHTPLDFLSVLRNYMERPSTRPTEPLKLAHKIDMVRDWTYGRSFESSFFFGEACLRMSFRFVWPCQGSPSAEWRSTKSISRAFLDLALRMCLPLTGSKTCQDSVTISGYR